jgi:hypothetical protein
MRGWNTMHVLLAEIANTLDGGGVYGSAIHYSFIILFVGGALIIFLYLWSKGRLDMDEEPKLQMMTENERYPEEKK